MGDDAVFYRIDPEFCSPFSVRNREETHARARGTHRFSLETGTVMAYRQLDAMKCSWLLLLGSSLILVGCTSFDTAWAKASKQPVAAGSLEGCWAGTWQSEANGHEGSLRCIVSRRTDGAYKARFHAIYRKVLGFRYSVVLRTSETNGGWHFSGEANLGWWAGGIYHYDGWVQKTNFFSTYSCKYDHGTFRMTRPIFN